MAIHPIHKVVISIQDANTRIELSRTTHTIIGRGGSLRAEWRATEEAKNLVLEFWARQWWHTHYGLTAEQFSKLAKDKKIDPLGSWAFEVIECRYIGKADTETGLMVCCKAASSKKILDFSEDD